jgi:hypothetical protein
MVRELLQKRILFQQENLVVPHYIWFNSLPPHASFNQNCFCQQKCGPGKFATLDFPQWLLGDFRRAAPRGS